MDKEIEAFRKEVERWRGDRRRGARRYPDAMRSTALQMWHRLQEEGATADGAAKRIGISAITLQLWREGGGRPKLVPVRVSARATPERTPQAVRLLSPRGYQVEVADVAMAAALLREVG